MSIRYNNCSIVKPLHHNNCLHSFVQEEFQGIHQVAVIMDNLSIVKRKVPLKTKQKPHYLYT